MKPWFLFFLLELAACLPAKAGVAYWVWERTKPLTNAEAGMLASARVDRLYWQAGTMTTDGSRWKERERFPIDWKRLNPGGTGPVIIPVLRLEPPVGSGLPEAAFPDLLAQANALVAESGGRDLQLDYECPDRLVPNYLDFLRHLKESGRTWRLSITALGHWSRFTAQFQGLADEIDPMFYDLNPDRESWVGGKGPALFDVATAEGQIASWKGCPIPWRAGLPNFSRVTVVDENGHSRGNIRRWSWDELWFSPLLQPSAATDRGATFFNLPSPGVLGHTPVLKGECLVVRYPDRAALQAVLPAVRQAGAEGAIYFRLAGSDDMSGFSPRDLARTDLGPPAFQLTQDASGRLILTNTSSVDLMPSISAPAGNAGSTESTAQRSYALVVHAEKAVWRDVNPGDFALVKKTDESGWESATLRFSFAHLTAEQSLQTGLVERAPGSDKVRITWRVDHAEKEDLWHEFNLPSR